MNELVSKDYPKFLSLIDLGSCSIHTMHNAFGNDTEKYSKDIDLLCLDICSLFKLSSARCIDFKELQKEKEVELDLGSCSIHT